MNDFDYDVIQKKKLARNAFHRKGTTNRKGCTLPYEYLSKKGREALNGEVKTLQLNERIGWKEFKHMSKEFQQLYLQHLMDTFGIGLSTIGRDLFGLSKSALAMHVSNNDIKLKSHTGGAISKAASASWQRWLDRQEPKEEAPVVEEEPTSTVAYDYDDRLPEEIPPFRFHNIVTNEAKEERPDNMESESIFPYDKYIVVYPMTGMSLMLKGTMNDVLNNLDDALPKLMDPDKNYRFNIRIDLDMS